MAKVDKDIEEKDAPKAVTDVRKNEKEMKLVSAMLEAKIVDVKPQLDFTTELGFIYPVVEQSVDAKGTEALEIVESLSDKGILKGSFFDRLLRCPRCQSINLRPSTHCPKCSSGDIVRGRILEHVACGYVGVEDEFSQSGKMSPKDELKEHFGLGAEDVALSVKECIAKRERLKGGK